MSTNHETQATPLSLTDALSHFLIQLEADGRSKHTIRQYARHIRLFTAWAKSAHELRKLAEIRHEHLAHFFANDAAILGANGARKSAASLNALRTSLRCFFGFCHAAEWLSRDPAKLLRRAQTRPAAPRPLPDLDRDRLLAELDRASTDEDRRDRVLFRLLLLAGLRIGSAIALDIEDLHLAEGELRIRKLKGGGEDWALVPDALIKDLREHLGTKRSGPVFCDRLGRRISIRQAQRRFAHWLDRAGTTREATPHSLRHSFATRLYEKTGDIHLVQTALCHRRVESTLVYARCDRERLRQAL